MQGLIYVITINTCRPVIGGDLSWMSVMFIHSHFATEKKEICHYLLLHTQFLVILCLSVLRKPFKTMTVIMMMTS